MPNPDPELVDYLPAPKALYYKNPSSMAKAIGLLIVLLFITFIAWSSLFKIDVAVMAQGLIASSSSQQQVKTVRSGILRELFVQDGDLVQRGQTLMTFDMSEEAAQLDSAEEEYFILGDKKSGYKHALEVIEGDLMRGDSIAKLLSRKNIRFEDDGYLYKSVMYEYYSLLVNLSAESRLIEAELNKLKVLESLQRVKLHKAQNHEGLLKQLIEKDSHPINDLAIAMLDKKIAIDDLDLVFVDEALQKLKGNNLQSDLEAFQHRKISELSKYISDLESSETLAKSRINQIEVILENSKIRAPSGGVYFGSMVSSAGEAITSGEQIASIVKDGAPIFELNVKSSDMGFIYVGQSVDIRLDAFAFTKYGSIIGKVAYIDPNSFSNEKGQLFYRIKAEMVENNIRVDGAIAPTSVGQSVSVNILVGKRTIMEYLLSPIFTGFRKSIREI